MSMRTALDRLLTTHAQDAGCEQTWALIDLYVEVVAIGGDPETMFPGISKHLESCSPCAQDYQGLLNAVTADPPGLTSSTPSGSAAGRGLGSWLCQLRSSPLCQHPTAPAH